MSFADFYNFGSFIKTHSIDFKTFLLYQNIHIELYSSKKTIILRYNFIKKNFIWL
jgi:hypothetical protein